VSPHVPDPRYIPYAVPFEGLALCDLVRIEPGYAAVEDEEARQRLREQLDECMTGLSATERSVLRLRFGLEDGQARTLQQVGDIYDLSRERIRQIEVRALRKMRHPYRSMRLRTYLDK